MQWQRFENSYYPMIRYTTHTGEQFTFRHFEAYDVQPGDRVIVLYDPANPTNFVIPAK